MSRSERKNRARDLTKTQLWLQIEKGDTSAVIEQLRIYLNNVAQCDKFVRCYNFKCFTNLLKWNCNEIKIMCLDIIANMCKDEFRQRIYYSSIIKLIVRMINFETDSTVLYSTYRLIGKLSECSLFVNRLYNAGILQSLSSTLVTSLPELKNVRVCAMAVRVMRKLSVHYFCRRKVIHTDSIKLIILLFLRSKEKSDVDLTYFELVDSCLKTLYAFLSNLYIICSKQIQIEGDLTLRYLVNCCKNKYAIRCIYKLCRIQNCFKKLIAINLMQRLINMIKLDQLEVCKEALGILFLFCYNDHRSEMAKYGGLQLIIMLLNRPALEEHFSILLHTLIYFLHCDGDTINIIKENEIIKILKNQINRMVAKINDIKQNLGLDGHSKIFRQRFYRNYMHGQIICKKHSHTLSEPWKCEVNIDIFNNDYIDENDWFIDEELLRADSEDRNNKKIAYDIERVLKFDDNCYCSTILTFISILSFHFDSFNKWNDINIVQQLLFITENTGDHRPFKALIQICRQPMYFTQLLTNGIICKLYHTQTSQMLKSLCGTEETKEMINEMSAILRTGEIRQVQNTALSIPLLYKISRKPISYLEHFLLSCGGLRIILQSLIAEKDSLRKQAFESIWVLTTILREIAGKDYLKSYMHQHLDCDFNENKDSDSLPVSNTVTFVLDDGSLVVANEGSVREHSGVFSVMLEGSSEESHEKLVRLKYVSQKSLTILVSVMNDSLEDNEIESLLDAILLADEFLMPKVIRALVERVIDSLRFNLCRAWFWAKIRNCDRFKLYCVAHLLLGKFTYSQTLCTFRNFLALDSVDEFLRDVECQVDEFFKYPMSLDIF